MSYLLLFSLPNEPVMGFQMGNVAAVKLSTSDQKCGHWWWVVGFSLRAAGRDLALGRRLLLACV